MSDKVCVDKRNRIFASYRSETILDKRLSLCPVLFLHVFCKLNWRQAGRSEIAYISSASPGETSARLFVD